MRIFSNLHCLQQNEAQIVGFFFLVPLLVIFFCNAAVSGLGWVPLKLVINWIDEQKVLFSSLSCRGEGQKRFFSPLRIIQFSLSINISHDDHWILIEKFRCRSKHRLFWLRLMPILGTFYISFGFIVSDLRV